ncbi:hypothetical protein [Microbacterium sp.]|uniref:hypothetical protein n=1 Tax=Microbacterium sp. TaxID=51671 RepID=UPI0025DA0E42|nr:hypothetical protein [Microbacterium sp.]
MLAIAVPVTINVQRAQAEAAENAAAEKAVAKAEAKAEQEEKDRRNRFNTALAACGMYIGNTTGVEILDDGEAVEFSGVAETFASDVQTSDLYCFLGKLRAPQSLEAKIGQTRALDGRQSEDWDGFTIEWTYHPDDGANVIIEQE